MNRILTAFFALAILTTPAFSQYVEVTNEALLEIVTVEADGKETITYEPTDIVRPGDAILYVMSYKNAGTDPVEGISLQSQIPSDIVITEGSGETENARVQYSVDGGNNFANRGDLVVTTADGQTRPAEATDLTNIMWTISGSLGAGETKQVSFRATVK